MNHDPAHGVDITASSFQLIDSEGCTETKDTETRASGKEHQLPCAAVHGACSKSFGIFRLSDTAILVQKLRDLIEGAWRQAEHR